MGEGREDGIGERRWERGGKMGEGREDGRGERRGREDGRVVTLLCLQTPF
jgi:hypothetical protein